MSKRRKLPWFKFEPAAWRADPCLRACSLAARGLWLEMLALMHEGEPYGHLTLEGKPMRVETLSRLVGEDVTTVKGLLAELKAAGVSSRTDGGTIYSRRMVRDRNRAENARENGRKGGSPVLRVIEGNQGVSTQGVNPLDKPPDKRTLKLREKEIRYKKNNPQSITPRARGDGPRRLGEAETLRQVMADAWLSGRWGDDWGPKPGDPGSPVSAKDVIEARRRRDAAPGGEAGDIGSASGSGR